MAAPQYMLEVYVDDEAGPRAVFRSDHPFQTFAKGDRIVPAGEGWESPSQTESMEIVAVEHLVWRGHEHVRNKVMLRVTQAGTRTGAISFA